MLAGDLILGCRVRINDLPRTLPAPSTAASAAIVVAASTLPIGNYYIVLTFTNSFGQTIATPESGPFNIADAAHSIQVTAPAIGSVPGATGINIYYGQTVGGENQWLPASSLPFTISNPGNPGIPPTRNTSFYPDADGQRISAYTLYSWLNEGLEQASKVSGGIPDMTGFPTINSTGSYVITGLWNKLDHGWWDGYSILPAGRDSLFYRNVVPGVVARYVAQQIADRIVLELQPQPNRSGAITTIANSVLATDTSIVLTDVSGFKLPFGMATLAGTNNLPIEIISFSAINATTLTGCVRGMGGTIPASYVGGGVVAAAEANCRLTGLRTFNSPLYNVGNQSTYLPIPAGWGAAIKDYMVARYRETEGNQQESARLMKSFNDTIMAVLKGNKLVVGPRQVGLPGESGNDVYPSRGLGGGLIIP